MRTLKLTIEYDGTDLVGWQRQTEGVSVQGLLEDALAAFEGAPVTVHGAGRTDAGAHALGQVASVTLRAVHAVEAIHRGLNVALPPAVRVLAIEEAPAGFHARFSAVSKTYEYRIVNAPFVSAFLHRYVWHVPGRLSVEAMREGASSLAGRHDFAAFQGAGTPVHNTVRTILGIEWHEGAGCDRPHVLRVEGDGFLRYMVRTIAGTLVEIGLGRWPPGRMAEVLASRDRAQAGPTAPASGLFLVRVAY
ncbi:MAG TPA: tRNA pseudouridine(38-40) synthase TruA [Vicinamibacterales bacterium]|nr:tRNA pseudouridine(38-40) synthase TruA [Vicinamibacterales bacterium]